MRRTGLRAKSCSTDSPVPAPEVTARGELKAARPLRGEIWELDLNPRKGPERHGSRPCLVVSTDALNISAFGTIVVCPVTTRERPLFRWRPALALEDLTAADPSWQAKPNWVATDQIVTVDSRGRAKRHLATVQSKGKMKEVDESLRMMLPLG
jgi:mRNA interferase MazF